MASYFMVVNDVLRSIKNHGPIGSADNKRKKLGMRRITIGQKVAVDEDMCHEFKMHTRFAFEDVPRRCEARDGTRVVRTCQPISKTVCGMLNSEGGRIYLGINDDGVIEGINMHPSQVDHFYLSLNDTLNRFRPAVGNELIKVSVLKVEENSAGDSAGKFVDYRFPGKTSNESSGFEHILRSPDCDCSKNNYDTLDNVLIIIEVVSKSKDGILYENEEGLVYRRRNGSNKLFHVQHLWNSVFFPPLPNSENDHSVLPKNGKSLREWICSLLGF